MNTIDLHRDLAEFLPKKRMVEVSSETKVQILIECPVTGEPAKKLVEIYVHIPNGQANWWRCSACQGWHLNVKDKHDQSNPGGTS